MQEPDKENDGERAKKMHNQLNGIAEEAAAGTAAAAGSGPSTAP
jgi:hypothetical protein